MLYLYFGSRLTRNAIEDVNSFAINWEIPLDIARVLYLKKIVELLSERDERPSYWDRQFGSIIKKEVQAPNIIVCEAVEPGGPTLPVIMIEDDYVKHKNMLLPIDDATLVHIGKQIEDEFGVEFLEFSREKIDGPLSRKIKAIPTTEAKIIN